MEFIICRYSSNIHFSLKIRSAPITLNHRRRRLAGAINWAVGNQKFEDFKLNEIKNRINLL